MKFKDFVGIDVSKHTLDVFILNVKVHKQFKNERLGFQQLEQWVQRQTCLAFCCVLSTPGFIRSLWRSFWKKNGFYMRWYQLWR